MISTESVDDRNKEKLSQCYLHYCTDRWVDMNPSSICHGLGCSGRLTFRILYGICAPRTHAVLPEFISEFRTQEFLRILAWDSHLKIDCKVGSPGRRLLQINPSISTLGVLTCSCGINVCCVAATAQAIPRASYRRYLIPMLG